MPEQPNEIQTSWDSAGPPSDIRQEQKGDDSAAGGEMVPWLNVAACSFASGIL
jgi:hypothetical protein